MQRLEDSGRAVLALVLVSGTARLHGEELELPLREFRLLAVLAQRVGSTVAPATLIEAVWPDAPWTAANDLYVLISKLRRLIDGPDKFGDNIRNRRGFGYVLDLNADEVFLDDGSSTAPTDDAIRDVSDSPVLEALVTPNRSSTEYRDDAPVEDASVAGGRSAQVERRRLSTLAALGLASVIVAASWGGGFALSRRSAGEPITSDDRPVTSPTGDRSEGKQPDRKDATADRGQRTKHDGNQRHKGEGSTPLVLAASGSVGSTDPSHEDVGSAKGSRKGSAEPAPALPSAPTRFLYHLVNADTGDHFVTTDASTASEYQAKGYEGGAIGRIYTSREEGTRAITTNGGNAYVFISADPETAPASQTVALWYSTNNAGDFFYTTTKAQAQADGWAASVIGYVRSL